MKLEVEWSSETLVSVYNTTRRHAVEEETSYSCITEDLLSCSMKFTAGAWSDPFESSLHRILLRFILILCSYLCLGLPNDLSLRYFFNRISYGFPNSLMNATCLVHPKGNHKIKHKIWPYEKVQSSLCVCEWESVSVSVSVSVWVTVSGEWEWVWVREREICYAFAHKQSCYVVELVEFNVSGRLEHFSDDVFVFGHWQVQGPPLHTYDILQQLILTTLQVAPALCCAFYSQIAHKVIHIKYNFNPI
jgi:hypothetical protein